MYLQNTMLSSEKTKSIAKVFLAIMLILPNALYLPLEIATGAFRVSLYPLFQILCIFLALWLVLNAWQLHGCLVRALQYNLFLENWNDSVVMVSEIARRLQYPSSTVIKDMRCLLEKGCLKNCVLEMNKGPRVRLMDVQNGQAVFASVSCTHCGSSARIRIGFTGACPYCGSVLRAPASGRSLYRGAAYEEKKSEQYGMPVPFFDDKVFYRTEQWNQVRFIIAGYLIVSGVFSVAASAFLYSTDLMAMLFAGCSSLLIFGCGILLFRRAKERRRLLDAACDYAVLFSALREAEVREADIAKTVGESRKKAEKHIEQCIRKGLLKGCEVKEGTLALLDASHHKSLYLIASCPHCAADVVIKKGSVSQCPHCLMYLDEEKLERQRDKE